MALARVFAPTPVSGAVYGGGAAAGVRGPEVDAAHRGLRVLPLQRQPPQPLLRGGSEAGRGGRRRGRHGGVGPGALPRRRERHRVLPDAVRCAPWCSACGVEEPLGDGCMHVPPYIWRLHVSAWHPPAPRWRTPPITSSSPFGRTCRAVRAVPYVPCRTCHALQEGLRVGCCGPGRRRHQRRVLPRRHGAGVQGGRAHGVERRRHPGAARPAGVAACMHAHAMLWVAWGRAGGPFDEAESSSCMACC